ncbi:hypothetical protein Glove_601g15 [Diversispora epigaea]|uniref:Uncharacterized protein n=1 Tax=Diversispora epigaea TaxID=1348612 RepID=A0A397G8Q8_9GLOM|nr:hypothetical protein Glove_601g15 [Diversispora epigaea]
MKVLEVLIQVCKLYTCSITMEMTIYSDDFTANVIKSILRIIGLDVVKKLSMEQKGTPDHSKKEIDRNLRVLQLKLGVPIADTDIYACYPNSKFKYNTYTDISLYNALKTNLNFIDHSELTWRDPEANMIIADNFVLVKIWDKDKCKEEIWNNFAFITSEIRSIQSEETYVTDIIVPLLQASLEDLPNGNIFLSIAEQQSMASKARKSFGSNEERPIYKISIGKKSNVMVMAKYGSKIFELAYVELSRILCTRSKREDDSVKDFGWYKFFKDASGILRYFHVDQVEISFTKNTSWCVEPLIRLLLTLRNIMIVNQSLLIQALEQANTRPSRNATQSPTVTSPSHK